jgi:hypothetical protein
MLPGFDVPMDNLACVGSLQTLANLDCELKRHPQPDFARTQQHGQRRTLYKRHHDEHMTVHLLESIDRAHVRVFDHRGCLCLIQEPRASIRGAHKSFVQELERGCPPQPVVLSRIDDTHATGSDELDNLVASDKSTGIQRHELVHLTNGRWPG